MKRVKFYSKEDMAGGYNLKNAELIIDNFDENKEYTNINELIEFYNICQYIDNEVFLKSWNSNYIEKAKNISKLMKSVICKWFNNNINDESIISEYNKLERNYKDDFFKILNDILNNIIIKDSTFDKLLGICGFQIYNILQNKKITIKYDNIIKNYMKREIENSTKILVDVYLIKDTKKKIYLPNSLTKTEKENIVISYLETEIPNINYLRLLINTPDSKDFSLSSRTKLKIKNKIKEQEDALFNKNSNNGLSTEFLVQIVPNLGEAKKEIFEDRKWSLSYNLDWIKDNSDFPTLLNNYIYLFDYVDKQMRWSNVSKKSHLGLFEGSFSMHAKDDYVSGFAFQSLNCIADMQQHAYYDVLKKNNIRLEEIIEWFFNTYLKNEFKINDFRASMPSKDSTYLEKCRIILPEMEGALKKYNFYIEDGYINHELVDISSTPLSFENIKSLLKNKYVYPNVTNDDYILITFALFSNQCMLSYIDRIGEKYNTFFELLRNEKITIEDIDEYDKSLFDKLIDYDLISVDKNGMVELKDIKAILVLKDLYYNEVTSYWKITSDYRKKINHLEVKGLVIFGNTLLSKPETDYLNFYLNRKKFINSLDLRNKYDHGTKSSGNEEEHYKNYMILLRLLILVIIKINDDLCVYNSDEYKNEQNEQKNCK